MKKETILNWLYMSHAVVMWCGGAYQVHYVFLNKSAEDITKLWVFCLLYAELVALPRCINSKFIVWKLCHIVGACLTVALAIGVILYGQ